jgi:D-amino peptidase
MDGYKKMKIMIRSDIEGVTGVTTYEEAHSSKWAREMLMNDLVALVTGLNEAGEHELVIYDEHTDGRNVILERLPENTCVICGKPLYRPDWGGIDNSYDGMILLGLHAKSGEKEALLPHSYSRKNLNIFIDDLIVGEIGIESAIAGDFGVPLLMVTADSAGVDEAKKLIPEVETVSVKKALGEFEAICYPPNKTASWIKEAARRVGGTSPKTSPLKIEGPVRLKIEFAVSDYTNKLKQYRPDLFVRDDMIMIEKRNVTEAWSEYMSIERKLKQEL